MSTYGRPVSALSVGSSDVFDQSAADHDRSSLSAALNAVVLKKRHPAESSTSGPSESRKNSQQVDTVTAIASEILSGAFRLRSTSAGTKIAQQKSQDVERETESISSEQSYQSYASTPPPAAAAAPAPPALPPPIQEDSDRPASIEHHTTSLPPLVLPTTITTLPKNKASQGKNSMNDTTLDVTQLPGYNAIPSDCPLWKRGMLEKKNKQLEEEAFRELQLRREEEEKWKGVPDWKRNLLEKRKL